MSSNIQPTSLANIANSQIKKQPGTSALGTGLETRSIHAWFGKNHVLSDISLDFPTGTVTALIGPSGCGKSTFLRTLNRMHEFIPGAAMAGEVLLHGKDIYAPGTDVTKIRLKIGMVFQKPNPFPSMTIGENVLAGLKLAQLKVSNKKELMEDALKLEADRNLAKKKTPWIAYASTAYQLAIVVLSTSILSASVYLFYGSFIFAISG